MDLSDRLPQEDLPTKTIFKQTNIKMGATIKYIDLEGRSDGRSIKKILSHVNPRKLILIHGSHASISHLSEYCMNNLKQCSIVMTPKLGELVNVASDTNIYRIRLKDSLIGSLSFHKVGDYELAWVDGVQHIIKVANQTEPILEPLPRTMEVTDFGVTESMNVKAHPAVFVGDVKLADFRQVLQKEGFQTEFKGGSLICNGVVSLRKQEREGKSKINIEGVLCEDYFRIRDLLYQQFKIL